MALITPPWRRDSECPDILSRAVGALGKFQRRTFRRKSSTAFSNAAFWLSDFQNLSVEVFRFPELRVVRKSQRYFLGALIVIANSAALKKSSRDQAADR